MNEAAEGDTLASLNLLAISLLAIIAVDAVPRLTSESPIIHSGSVPTSS